MAREKIRSHAEDYRRIVEALRDETLHIEAARAMLRINSQVDELLREAPERA